MVAGVSRWRGKEEETSAHALAHARALACTHIHAYAHMHACTQSHTCVARYRCMPRIAAEAMGWLRDETIACARASSIYAHKE